KSVVTDVGQTNVAGKVTSDYLWTRNIKTGLTKMAYETFKLDVWSEPNDHDNTVNEWLYDFVMYEKAEGTKWDIKKIHLILESEWNSSHDEIKYDFYKLLQGRSE